MQSRTSGFNAGGFVGGGGGRKGSWRRARRRMRRKAIRCDDDDDDDEVLVFFEKERGFECVFNGTDVCRKRYSSFPLHCCGTHSNCLPHDSRAMARHLCQERGAIMQAAMQMASLRPLLTFQSARIWLLAAPIQRLQVCAKPGRFRCRRRANRSTQQQAIGLERFWLGDTI
jgi:hypothetical protein